MAFCTKCGASLAPGAAYCAACGKAVDVVDALDAVDASVAPATAAEVVPTPVQATGPVTRDEAVRLFIGARADEFLEKWKLAEGRRNKLAWSWIAFLLGFLWMTYRKMYTYAWIFIGLVVVETLAEFAFDVSSTFSNAINIAVAVVFGWMGNRWYQTHVDTKVAEIIANQPPDRVRDELVRQGGTSVAAAVGFAAIFVACLFVAVYISQLALGVQ